MWAFPVVASKGYSLVVVRGRLTAVASLVAEQPSELSPSHPFGGCQLDAFYIMWLRTQRTFFKKALLLLLLSRFGRV